MKIAVIGATGYVGDTLVRSASYAKLDVQLRLFGRNKTKLETLQEHSCVESIHPYEQGDSLDGLMHGIDACIDLSYQTSGIPSKQIQYSTIHAKNLVAVCKKEGIARLCIVGTVAVYGTSIIRYKWREVPNSRKLDFPDSVYSRVKSVVEKVASDEIRGTDTQLALVRSGHVFGVGSRMVTNICSSVLNGNCLLLENRIAPSNATTVKGLNSTLLKLCTSGWDLPIVIANHIDLCNISYDRLVRFLGDKIKIEPITCPDVRRKKVSVKTKLIQSLLTHQEKFSVLQSYVGLSERLVATAKSSAKRDGIQAVGNSAGLNSASARIAPLYDSESVPHTSKVCGDAITPQQFDATMSDVARWIQSAGYLER